MDYRQKSALRDSDSTMLMSGGFPLSGLRDGCLMLPSSYLVSLENCQGNSCYSFPGLFLLPGFFLLKFGTKSDSLGRK